MLVPILLGSTSDEAHALKIVEILDSFGIKSEIYVVNGHKVPELVLDIVNEFNQRDEAMVYLTISNQSNSLSGIVSATAIHPVIACPRFKDQSDYLINIHSSTMYPSDVPSLLVLDPKNAAHAVIRILALTHSGLSKRVAKHLQEMKEGF